MARRLTVAAAIVLALGLAGCDRRYCEQTPPDDVSALLQAMFCWNATFPDSAQPEALIALDKTLIDSGETVRLDGSGSSDAEGRIDLYEWDIDGRPGYEISTGDRVIHRPITYDPIIPASSETRSISLQVTDDEGLTAIAGATVTIIEPLPEGRPRALFNASPNPVPVGASAIFDASASAGAETYEWDTDGNGTFEVTPSRSRTTTRVYDGPPRTVPVTLRIVTARGVPYTATVDLRVGTARATAAARRPPLAVRLTRVRFPGDLGTAKRRGAIARFDGLRVTGRLAAARRGLGALHPFRRARWTARLTVSADTRSGVARVRGHALARFPRGAGRACLRVTAQRRRGAPAGRIVLLGGSGDAARLRGAGRFRFRFIDATPAPAGRLRARLGRARSMPRACAGL
jgi:hypothetical protein